MIPSLFIFESTVIGHEDVDGDIGIHELQYVFFHSRDFFMQRITDIDKVWRLELSKFVIQANVVS